jgi:hypothetical protein
VNERRTSTLCADNVSSRVLFTVFPRGDDSVAQRALEQIGVTSAVHSTSPEPIRFAKRVSHPIRNGILAYFGVYSFKCENGIPRQDVAEEEKTPRHWRHRVRTRS